MKKRATMAIALVALVAMLSTTAMAARDPGEDYKLTITGLLYKSGDIWWGGAINLYAGAVQMRVDDYTGGNALVGSRTAWFYCIDQAKSVSPDWYKCVTGGIPSPNIPPITPDAWARKVWLVDTYGTSSLQSSQQAAGLQLAIWETITDSDGDLTAGGFYLPDNDFGATGTTDTSQARDWAEYYLSNVQFASAAQIASDRYFISGDTSDTGGSTGQNFNEVRVPEPITACLALLGLSTLAGFRRLRSR